MAFWSGISQKEQDILEKDLYIQAPFSDKSERCSRRVIDIEPVGLDMNVKVLLRNGPQIKVITMLGK